jgi:hypothetical protein
MFLPLGHRKQERANYLIQTKEGLVLVSAPYYPHESFFNQGQQNTISNFIRAYMPFMPPRAGLASVDYSTEQLFINNPFSCSVIRLCMKYKNNTYGKNYVIKTIKCYFLV